MKKIVTLFAVVAVMVAAQAAMAGSSTVLGAYGSNSAKPIVKVNGATSTANAAAQPKGATLPFTGADLVVVSIAGVALLGLGLGLRRVGRDKT
jgi:hypothetical protein